MEEKYYQFERPISEIRYNFENKMKTKPICVTHKTGYQVVEEKLRIANAYLKKIDMNQLHDTVEQVRKKQN